MIPIRHKMKIARNLLDAKPAMGASLGMRDTGPAKKNLDRLKEAEMQLIRKEAMGRNSELNTSMVDLAFPYASLGKNDDEAMIIAKEMWTWKKNGIVIFAHIVEFRVCCIIVCNYDKLIISYL